jgi:hypothetical protein
LAVEQGAGRKSTLTAMGFVDYRRTTASPGTPPFPVEFRRWTLRGLTLTRSATVEQGCFGIKRYRPVITPGGC